MLKAVPAALVGAAAIACAPFTGPSAGAPWCPADRPDNYVVMGSEAPCRLRDGQRFIVQMPRDGTDAKDKALQTICFSIFKGTVFVVNFGQWDYCGLPRVQSA